MKQLVCDNLNGVRVKKVICDVAPGLGQGRESTRNHSDWELECTDGKAIPK